MDDLGEKRVQRERRYQSVLLTMCSAGMIWLLQTILSISSDIARIQPRIDALDVQMSLMYRASDARRDNDGIAARMGGLETRVERLERRHEGSAQ